MPDTTLPATTLAAVDMGSNSFRLELATLQHGRYRRLDYLKETVRQGNGLAAADGRYDLVLCNPPYVNRASMQALPAEYRAEPALALDGNFDGGDDGMDFIRPLLRGLPAHLTPGGVLLLEIGHERLHFEAAFPHLQPLWLSTSAGDDAVLLLTRENLE